MMPADRTVLTPVTELEPGDLVDLQGDCVADPDSDQHSPWAYEYAEVVGWEPETGTCIRVDFDSGSVGFPVFHELRKVVR